MNKYAFILLWLSLIATIAINMPAVAKETSTDSSRGKTTERITDGKYLTEQNLFEVTLQVQGDQFRLQEAGHSPERWQSVSKLQYVKLGILYFDGFYWCSEHAPKLPQNLGKPISIYPGISRACTANGWVEK